MFLGVNCVFGVRCCEASFVLRVSVAFNFVKGRTLPSQRGCIRMVATVRISSYINY